MQNRLFSVGAFAITLILFSGIAYASTSIATAPLAKIHACKSLVVTSNVVNAIINTQCKWNGGTIYIYAAGGKQGAVSFTITGANGITYFTGRSITSWCNTYMGSINAPAQTYNIMMTAGQGGGKCGNATVSLSANVPLCSSFKVQTSQQGTTIQGICKWSGGVMNIYSAAGWTGGGSFTITGLNHITYVSNSLNKYCLALTDNTNLPAQKYLITINTGSVAGSCGNAIVEMK